MTAAERLLAQRAKRQKAQDQVHHLEPVANQHDLSHENNPNLDNDLNDETANPGNDYHDHRAGSHGPDGDDYAQDSDSSEEDDYDHPYNDIIINAETKHQAVQEEVHRQGEARCHARQAAQEEAIAERRPNVKLRRRRYVCLAMWDNADL